MRTDVRESEHLVQSRNHGELLGFDRVGTGPVEERGEVRAHLGPRLFEPGPGVELLCVQPSDAVDRRRCVTEGNIEGVPERMGGIGGAHERAQA
jgi:hypothetical protein